MVQITSSCRTEKIAKYSVIVVVGAIALMHGNRVVTAAGRLRAAVRHSQSFVGRQSATVVRDGALKATYPKAVIDGPLSATVNEPLVVDPTGSQPPKGQSLVSGTLQWGDGEMSNWSGIPTVTSHIYKVAGTFALTLTVVSSTGKSATVSTTATILGAVPYALIEPEQLIHDGSFKVPDGFDYQGSA